MHKTIFRFVAISALCSAFLCACDTACPAGHDPLAAMIGESCGSNQDCLVECVCETARDTKPIKVGNCSNGECTDPTDLCEANCTGGTWTGEFCSPGD